MQRRLIAENGSVNGQEHVHQRAAERAACNETRSTRLHYQLRCLLPPGHDSDHRWTPELLVRERPDEVAAG
jgi:hypothetical protein